ncbi:response regulator transcription factor [Sphingobacterium kyonggiense]|uniref:response regulator transcription factor n=1 Tax=Sphingobacterium kyonggiense TaxID=714075 RepID=UPI003CD06DFE
MHKQNYPSGNRGREKEVFNYLSKGLSSVQIAELMFVSPLTVDVHRRNLLQKFKVNKTVNLLQKVKDLNLLD